MKESREGREGRRLCIGGKRDEGKEALRKGREGGILSVEGGEREALDGSILQAINHTSGNEHAKKIIFQLTGREKMEGGRERGNDRKREVWRRKSGGKI